MMKSCFRKRSRVLPIRIEDDCWEDNAQYSTICEARCLHVSRLRSFRLTCWRSYRWSWVPRSVVITIQSNQINNALHFRSCGSHTFDENLGWFLRESVKWTMAKWKWTKHKFHSIASLHESVSRSKTSWSAASNAGRFGWDENYFEKHNRTSLGARWKTWRFS